MIDTHAHIDMDCYKDKFDILINNINLAGVEKVIIPGIIPEGFDRIIYLTEKYKNLYGAVGVHPSELKKAGENWIQEIEKCIHHPKIIAIGEIGLDYYWDKDEENHILQKDTLIKQINIAKNHNLPILIHDRDAHGDCFDIISENIKSGEIPVIMHCFSGSPEFAKRCINQGFYLALGGVVTFKNAKKIKEVAKIIPLDRLLLETDSPYLTPVPHRGEENSPAYIKFVAEEIAKIKGISFEEVITVTTQNAYNIFNFGGLT